MDKMVEIARFQYPADAQTLVALLKSEGIDCSIRNEITTQLIPHIDIGGARVEINAWVCLFSLGRKSLQTNKKSEWHAKN